MNSSYEDMDLKIINFIKMLNNQDNESVPKPSDYSISTQSGIAFMENILSINLSKIIIYIAKNIIHNIALKKNPNYLIQGLVVDNIIIRFDECYLKKYKKPLMKFMNSEMNPESIEDCMLILGNIDSLENNSLKKHGRQKKKKDNEYFYNSCSIIVKASIDIKCVNIKLFNNGKISLTGSKNEMDGFYACSVLLEELKKYSSIFIEFDKNNEEYINSLISNGESPEIIESERLKILSNSKINGYKITMINSNFNTNFKIDLLKLLNILNSDKYMLFTKFNPEKYRGLIIGYYWNKTTGFQNGKCHCTVKCSGKGNGQGNGKCKKVTISIFKSGSIIITGGCLIEQVNDAYDTINNILKDNYKDIVKLSILDFISENDNIYDNYEDSLEKDNDKINEIENKSFSIKLNNKNVNKKINKKNKADKLNDKKLEKKIKDKPNSKIKIKQMLII
jgi:TATA-box binding protein (TBP) (component of TFIID and TFIIIB)